MPDLSAWELARVVKAFLMGEDGNAYAMWETGMGLSISHWEIFGLNNDT